MNVRGGANHYGSRHSAPNMSPMWLWDAFIRASREAIIMAAIAFLFFLTAIHANQKQDVTVFLLIFGVHCSLNTPGVAGDSKEMSFSPSNSRSPRISSG